MMDLGKLKKANGIIIFLFGVLAALYMGSGFFIPFIFAAFLATLVRPVSERLEKQGINRVFSSLLSTLLVFITISGLITVLFYQLQFFLNDLPRLQEELNILLSELQEALSSATGVSPEQQIRLVEERSETISRKVESALATFLNNTFFFLMKFLLTMVYLFLLLLGRSKFTRFFLMYLPNEKKEKGKQVIEKTTEVAFQYLWGRILVMSVLATMYIITFLIFDVQYAILLTVFGALITVIPYIGPLISGLLPILIFMLSGNETSTILLFAAVILVIQLIESYVLEPLLMGKQVNLSALMIIVAIVIGGMMWGIAGMILFVPIFAVSKIVFDELRSLQPVGYLIGNKD